MDIVSILIWILLGAVIGYVASVIMGTARRTGGLLTVIIGIVGSFLGGWLWQELRLPVVFKTEFLNLLLSGLIGAILLIAILKGLGLIKGKK